jgi:hypothetical protein
MLEEEKAISQLDVLNAMEKRRIISSFQEWKRLRNVRNAFMHDYPEHSFERAEALTLAANGAQEILAVLDRIGAYAVHHIGIKLPDRG